MPPRPSASHQAPAGDLHQARGVIEKPEADRHEAVMPSGLTRVGFGTAQGENATSLDVELAREGVYLPELLTLRRLYNRR